MWTTTAWVATFELDLAFAPEEIAIGLERLFAHRGLPWSRTAAPGCRYKFATELRGGDQALLSVTSVPAERQNYPGFFPRALLRGHAEDAAGLEALRREIVLTFLRVMG